MSEPIRLVDSHCHVAEPEFDEDRAEVLARAAAAGVTTLVCVGATGDVERNRPAVALAGRHGDVEVDIPLRETGSSALFRAWAEKQNAYFLNLPSYYPRDSFYHFALLQSRARYGVTRIVRTGDRIITSGHGGVFPPGLPVGVVASLDGGVPRVEPYVELSQLGYVLVVDYGLSGALPQPVLPPSRAVRRGKPLAVDETGR